MIRMHDLDFTIKTTQTESILLSLLSYELKKRLAKVRTSAIAYSPIVSARFEYGHASFTKLPLCME